MGQSFKRTGKHERAPQASGLMESPRELLKTSSYIFLGGTQLALELILGLSTMWGVAGRIQKWGGIHGLPRSGQPGERRVIGFWVHGREWVCGGVCNPRKASWDVFS